MGGLIAGLWQRDDQKREQSDMASNCCGCLRRNGTNSVLMRLAEVEQREP